MLKRILKVFLVIVIAFAVIVGAGVFYITRGLSSGEKLVVNAVDLANINDGVYSGRYDAGRFSNELKVTVLDHRITSIEIVKDLMIASADMSNKLFGEVLSAQNTSVDAVSGATVSSRAYLKSIENALKK